MRGVLVDTGPLYALAIPSDQYYARAKTEQGQIINERLPVFALYPVIAESYSLILRRVSPPIAHRWVNYLLERVDLLNPTDADFREAIRLVQHYQDQKISLFDALLATLANDLEVALWSFDSHFDTMRAPVWRAAPR